jgi:PIN domain nuclease of toxin-antitoxin system
MAGGYLLDTCALLWLLEEAELDSDAREQIDAAARDSNLWVLPISAWEVGVLSAQGKLVLSMPVETWFEQILELPGVGLAELRPGIFIDSTSLPGDAPGDIADRLMVAAARAYGLTLVTRDKALLDYAAQGYIQAIAC